MTAPPSSDIARPPVPQIPGYPVCVVIGPALHLASPPYLEPGPRLTVWTAALTVQADMRDGEQLVVACPECGQLHPWQSAHTLLCCGYCGSLSSLPIVAA